MLAIYLHGVCDIFFFYLLKNDQQREAISWLDIIKLVANSTVDLPSLSINLVTYYLEKPAPKFYRLHDCRNITLNDCMSSQAGISVCKHAGRLYICRVPCMDSISVCLFFQLPVINS